MRENLIFRALFCLLVLPLISAGSFEDEPSYQRLGTLNAIVIENSREAPYVVFLHGYGGTGFDAYEQVRDAVKQSQKNKSVNWIFPDAPSGGWFDILATNRLTREPDYRAWEKSLAVTRRELKKLIKAAKLKPEDIVWSGFSQGAITAVDYVLHDSGKPMGLVVNAGMYFESKTWNHKRTDLKAVPFAAFHDKTDQMLLFENAQLMTRILSGLGMVGKLRTHNLDHEVPIKIFKNDLFQIVRNQSCMHFYGKSK